MKLYDGTQEECLYGHFNKERPAGYTLTEPKELKAPWYYIYQNRKILLYMDQNGPVKMQYQPPSGILVFKRETGENQSKWQVWIQSDDVNEGVPVSNFGSPTLRYDLKKPKYTVDWEPTKAIYTTEYDNLLIKTEVFVPVDKATACMKVTVKNIGEKELDLTITPSIFPYVNIPQMVAWDLPEWYLHSKAFINDSVFSISGQMLCPKMVEENNRSVTVNSDYEPDAQVELSMIKYAGTGNFFAPESVIKNGDLSYKMKDCEAPVDFGDLQAVYAVKYKKNLLPGEEKTYTQVITVQNSVNYSEKENKEEALYFNEESYTKKVKETEKFYMDMFSKRHIETENPLLNDFVNYFTPLQMYWVCSLDRGWPSSMRGIRDASQDFMGMTYIDPIWTRKLILELLEHQRKSDGWFPRQISTISRTAPHDMRYFCDGGAFFLELVHEYMSFTRDYDLLNEKVCWLESDEESTVLKHILKTVDFYLDEMNIGEHDLVKVWYGDWWDTMDQIGMDGRGESVTVTAQNVLNLKNFSDMFSVLVEEGRLGIEYIEIADKYLKYRERFKVGLLKYAYNKNGFFNGYFNDNGRWLLSDCDPDGKNRLYLVSNAWAIISGCADKAIKESVINNIEKECFAKMGYNTHSVAFDVHIDKAGREGIGNGNYPVYPYNHAQSFYARACCVAGNPELAYKATRYILPIEEKYAPVEKTMAPPFSIVNQYSSAEATLHQAKFQYLSGTVSYVLRIFYSFFMGITYCYDGLTIKHCLPREFGDCNVKFEFLGKKFEIKYNFTDGQSNRVIFNGKEWDKTRYSIEAEKEYPFFADADFLLENIIEIDY